ncbi:MAG: membrane protein insertion efficiency factor YidD [bacterium]|nr:membrane protein insertion efficiency factor YidD [bacterium]
MKKFLINLIKLYKKYFKRGYKVCKYYPSCSDYSIVALEKYGVLKGGIKSIIRIIKCNPFSKGGIDFP